MILTFEVHDDGIPAVETFSTGYTVRQLASGAARTAITLIPGHPVHTHTPPRVAVTLMRFGAVRVTVTGWVKENYHTVLRRDAKLQLNNHHKN